MAEVLKPHVAKLPKEEENKQPALQMVQTEGQVVEK
jgi:hypothetical protein